MFKPTIGICTCHGLKRLIVVRAGLCKQGNDEKKKKSKLRPSYSPVVETGKTKTIRATNTGGFKANISRTEKQSKRPHQSRISNIENGRVKKDSCVSSTGSESNGYNRAGGGKIQPKRTERSSINKNGKIRPTGELAIFKEIYEERGPYSQISRQWVDFAPICFSHVLSKGAYPSFRLYKKNIVIKTAKEHQMWETERHKLKDLPEWAWFFELEQELKHEYYEKQRSPDN